MKASDYIIRYLADRGVTFVFEFIGGMTVHLIDSISKEKRLRRISMHHEQSAGFAAEAVSRLGGGLGVAMATSGPGAVNLLTAIGSCYFDSVPCVFITGQVNTYESKNSSAVRQVGFQETDIVSMARPITKYSKMITRIEELPAVLAAAFTLAQEERPGPVLIDIPMDLQKAEYEFGRGFSGEFCKPQKPINMQDFLSRMMLDISKASRPLILMGGGVRTSGAVDCFRETVRYIGIPIVSSLMGLDAYPHYNDLYQGMIGSYGNRNANIAVTMCDFLLVLGSRLDTRQTGTLPGNFAHAAAIYWVDVDPAELSRGHVKVKESLCCDLKKFLPELLRSVKLAKLPEIKPWRENLVSYKKKYYHPENSLDATQENRLINRVVASCPENAIICVDVGQHQMWAAQSFKLRENQRFLTSGGMGAMGFSLPAAVGATLARPGVTALVIVGDGSLQVNIQELDTIVREKLTIKILVLDNGCLGMVRQFQETYFEGRTPGTVDGYSCPDFTAIASAYKLETLSSQISEVNEKHLDWLFEGVAPKLLHVKISSCSQVQPKLIINSPLYDMYPPIRDEDS